MKKIIVILSVLSAFLPGVSGAVDRKTLEEAGAQALDEKAPDLAIVDSAGKTFNIRDLRGRAVILHFWASWCTPCKREFPLLEKIYEDVKGAGLEVIAVSIEDGANLPEMKRLAASFGAAFPVYAALGANGAVRYWSLGVPETYFIGKNGDIAGRFVGEGRWGDEKVKKLVKELVEE